MAALEAPLSVLASTSPASVSLPLTAPAPEQQIRIGLGRGLATAAVTAPYGLDVIADGESRLQTKPGEAVTLQLAEGKIQVAGLAQPYATPVRLVPLPAAENNPVGYKGKTYRGEIEVLISPSTGNLSVVNVLGVEAYLQGVVSSEMPSGWHPEALKSQAVAARTYAMANLGKRRADGFDLLDTTSDQVYGGIGAERLTTNNAVAATRGQVLTYDGRYASTLFHSSSGGHTENNEYVWSGSPVAYLRGVVDYDNLPGNAARYSWHYSFTADQLTQLFANAGYAVGQVSSVAPAGVVSTSGRPTRWQVEGGAGSATLTAEQMRWALALPAAPRSIQLESGGTGNLMQSYTGDQSVYALGADGTSRPASVSNAYVVGADGQARTGQAQVVAMGPVGQLPGGAEVAGGGWGHGVGLSQWGAYGMALQGRDYVAILTHFYQGTKVETR